MKIREIATGLQFPEGPIAMDDGSVLLVEIARGTLSRVLPDGRVQVVADLGGGPNGAAIGPDGAVYVCNNGGFRWAHRDRRHASARSARPRTTRAAASNGSTSRPAASSACTTRVEGLGLRGPNDIVFDAAGGFYFTDLGKVRDTEIDRGGVFYGQPDGRSAHVIARPVMTPNGIAPFARRQHAVLRRDRGRAPLGLRHHGAGRGAQGRLAVAARRADARRVARRPLPALRLDGGRRVRQPLRRDADARRHQHRLARRQHARATCRCRTASRPTSASAARTGAPRSSRLSGSGRLIAIDDWPVPGLEAELPGLKNVGARPVR